MKETEMSEQVAVQDDATRRYMGRANCSPETCILTDMLNTGVIGDELSDARMAAECGKDTHPGGYGYAFLMSAIRLSRAEKGLVWQRLRGENKIRCLGGVEIINRVENRTAGLRRRSRVSIQELIIASSSTTTQEGVTKINTLSAVHGAIACLTSKRNVRKLVECQAEQPNIKTLLGVFSPKKKESKP